ncbi:MAG: UDP-N-acetylmuramoyl-tripeptide--D-alanyl-D-alanine ligase [Terrimesophilobacter sp.]
MIALTLAELAASTDGALHLPDGVSADTAVSGSVQTDSRRVTGGSIFFALQGESTDGHLFVPAAVDAGAALVVTEHHLDTTVPQIVVANGVAALAALAHSVVARVRAEGALSVVAITGSNGKTTTKNMVRAILESSGPTVAPEGSYNNHVGAPLAMLAVDHDTRYLVVEMGANHVGDIAKLISIVTPDVAVVLKVGFAHAGDFGSLAATQRAKSEMVTQLPSSAVAVLNIDDSLVAEMAAMTAARVAWFGLGDGAEIRAENIETSIDGTSFTLCEHGATHRVTLRILGEHHVMNALAALSVASQLGVSMPEAIGAIERMVKAERWRMEVLHPGGGIVVINDAYNASPDSMAAALKTLAQITAPDQRSVAVLGEMADLGDIADEEHDRIGRLVVRLNIAKLIVVGHRARHIHNAAGLEGSWNFESVLVPDADAALEFLSAELHDGDVVLVKSSNSAKLRFLGDRLGGVS